MSNRTGLTWRDWVLLPYTVVALVLYLTACALWVVADVVVDGIAERIKKWL